MNQVYSVIMIVAVALVLTAQTAYATTNPYLIPLEKTYWCKKHKRFCAEDIAQEKASPPPNNCISGTPSCDAAINKILISQGSGPITHDEGPVLATTGPMTCNKSGCEASIGQVGNGTSANSTTGLPGNMTDPNAKTNEHDYKLGYKQGELQYQEYYESTNDQDDNAPPQHDDGLCNGIDYAGTVRGHMHVTNMTSCIDGFVNGFKHWCIMNTRDCSLAAVSGQIPIQLETNPKYHDKSAGYTD